MKETLAIRLVYASWRLLALLPFAALYLLSDFFYLLLRYVIRYRYRVLWQNISSSFPEKSRQEQQKIINGFYRWFGDYIVETIKLAGMSQQELRKRMVFTGVEQLQNYIRQGRSCAFYLGHYGQWEWITSFPNWIDNSAQCLQIYHTLENPTFDAVFRKVRERQGSLCVPMEATLRKVVEYQRANRPIVMGYIADQVPFWNNIHHWLDFLHHDTPVLTGSERIVRRANQVAFYLDIKRIKRGYYRCELVLLTDNPNSMAEFELTDKYFALLEENIQSDPHLYLWSHNRWKRTRQEYNLRYNPETGVVFLGSLDELNPTSQNTKDNTAQ